MREQYSPDLAWTASIGTASFGESLCEIHGFNLAFFVPLAVEMLAHEHEQRQLSVLGPFDEPSRSQPSDRQNPQVQYPSSSHR